MSHRTIRWSTILVLANLLFSSPVVAHEPPSGLLIHLPFEGSVENVGRAHVQADIITSDPGTSGSLGYATGYPGQAAVLDGEHAIRVPFDLHPDFYPQLTVTMWIKAGTGQQSGFLFSSGAPSGAKIQFAKGQISALGPRVQSRVRYTAASDEWVLIAGVWDYVAGSVAAFANGEMTAVGFDAGMPRDHNFARADFWIGTYDDRAGSTNTVGGILIDEVRVYDRALSKEELFGMAIGPPIQEEPRLGEPLLPPEEASEPHEPPPGIGSEPEPRPGRRDVAPDSSSSGTRPGEDPMLDKLRRTQAPGGHHSDDAVRDAIGDDYEPGPTTDWEQAKREAREQGVSEEQLERMRETVGREVSAGTARIDDTVREQLGTEGIPESTDFETRRQGMDPEGASRYPDSVEGKGMPAGAGTLEVKPLEDGELYVRIKAGAPRVSPWSSTLSTDQSLTLDLEDSAIHTIEWYERSDVPCKMVIFGYVPGTNQFGGPNIKRFGRDECSRSPNDRSKKTVSLISQGAAITALTAIGNKAKLTKNVNHMKGIRVEGLRISSDATLTTDGAQAVAKRANASDGPREGSRVSCPGGYVATGLKVGLHYDDSANSPSMGALALICREVDD